VDLASGFWVEAKVDLYLNDVLPIVLTRTYRQGDPNVQDFGVGMTLNYELYLWSANLYQDADLITPAGGRIHYVRVTPGNGPVEAIYTTSNAPGPYFNSKIFWNGNGWTLLRPDGMSYVFSPNAGIEYMQDRYGNRISFTRSGGIATPITAISSSNGRSINLTYTNGVVTSATDNIGRTVSYTYDTSRRMQTVTDPDGGITTYTWDTTNNRITAVQRPRQNPNGPAAVTNSYDSNGRVQTQTLPDSKTWQFAYTLDGSGKVIETDVTDPNSNVRKVTFNSAGYWLTDKRAFGSAVEQDFTAVRGGTTPPSACTGNTSANSPTNYLIAETDALGRLSCWTYDPAGSVLTVTKLAGTADQITTTLAYGAFEQITQITDPLSHTTTIGRDSLGRPTSITDALSHIWTISTNTDGTTASITDPLSHSTAFGYDHGDLVTMTDPLGRVITRYSDAAGRGSRWTDPLANLWQSTFDPVWGRHQTTDPNANTTTINFNNDGLVSAVVDPRNTIGSPIQTQFTYDTKDRLTVRTDALSHADTITSYDGNDNVLTATDRNGRNVTYTYDALNRISTATYADGHVVSYTWDGGNRLTQIQDTVSSVSNTITRAYDGLDRLMQEQVVQGGTTLGTVNYTYDASSRRATMTVSGQSQVTYTWDNADRLTQVAQGSAIVGFTYDNANRRATLTLPNGIIATYTYDVASQLTQLSYDNGTTNVGTLTYNYDNAGRITSRAGTLFQSVLPAAVASTGYNAGNQLTQWGSASPTYDLNGNLTSDGTNSYTWDARNRLTALTGIASFVYDGSGRRQSLTKSGVTLTSVYDGYDPVQEQSGGSVLANLLTGLRIDERFTRTESSTTSTFLIDALGSTVALTDSSAAVQTSYSYDPYGVTSTSGSAGDNPFQFTGRQNDGTGLYYYRARYYNPAWGRFVSQDPIGFGGGINLYIYARSAPTMNLDVFGLQSSSLPIRIDPPGGFLINPNNGQMRIYDMFGNAACDVDVNHDHGAGTPHLHFWDGPTDRSSPGIPMPRW
jgi:RHS repeat-associated protein